MSDPLELLVRREGERVLLLAPDVGRVTGVHPKGTNLTGGQTAGVLLRLGRSVTLTVPAGVSGTVASEAPGAFRQPVGAAAVLYELLPLAAGDAQAAAEDAEVSAADAMLSPQSGRFYRKPSPADPDFVSAGDVIQAGDPIGLIEVMKTFAQVPYAPGPGLPERAKVIEVLVADGADVDRGTPLLRVEPA